MKHIKNSIVAIALLASQNVTGQIDTISDTLRKKIHDNFIEYKKHIHYPHDTITIQTKELPENPYEQQKNILTLAMGEPYGTIKINTKAKEEYITDEVILHELTHTLKDSISIPLDYTLNDGAKIIGINGLTFEILTPDGHRGVFGLIEEAAAEYIAHTIKPSENFTDPRYYALQYFMRILAEKNLLSAKDLAIVIQTNDIRYMTHLFNIEKNKQRGDILLGVFSAVYQLGGSETNHKKIEEKVRDFIENHIRF